MTGRDAAAGIAARGGPFPADEHGPETGFHRRALSDPVFRARFEAAYTGDDDPLDALWWLDSPATAAPSGAPAPAALAAAARRDLYGPGTDPTALRRYEQAVAAADRSRGTALAALARLTAHPLPGEPPAAEPEAPHHLGGRAAGRRRRAVLPVLAIAAVLLAFGIGLGLRLDRTVPPTRAPVEHFQQTVTGSDALTVFDRAPEPADLLGGDLEPLDTVSLHRLVAVGTARFFAARTNGPGAAVCLLAADGSTRTAATCTPLGRFLAHGVTLAARDGLPSGFAQVRWEPNGRLDWWSTVG